MPQTVLVLVAVVAVMFAPLSDAFQPMWRRPSFSSSSSSSSSLLRYGSTTGGADFEYQELRAQLNAMKLQRVASRDLTPIKRQELTTYAQEILEKKPSLVPLKDIGQALPGTKWRLAFSTNEAALGDLPRDADVLLEFIDESNLNYILQFSQKTLGLNRLVAKSTYTVDSGPVNPGLVTFVYEDITTDVFGFQNMSVGFFGLLKGRANYVESAYFDGKFWMERGTTPTGQEFYNVYIREQNNDE